MDRKAVSMCINSDWCGGYNEAVTDLELEVEDCDRPQSIGQGHRVIHQLKATIRSLRGEVTRLEEMEENESPTGYKSTPYCGP